MQWTGQCSWNLDKTNADDTKIAVLNPKTRAHLPDAPDLAARRELNPAARMEYVTSERRRGLYPLSRQPFGG
jgi:hypothetical protein